ncbi:MAG: AAA family ATPase, partial [Pseudomonadota bacterium]
MAPPPSKSVPARSASKESNLPPYLQIDPDQAAADLGTEITTARFADIAEACTRGRQDLASRGLEGRDAKHLRLFSTWEITRYLISVAPPHFRRVLKANPDLPQGRTETEGGAKWFTLDEVLRLRAHFATQGSKAKEYRPYRPVGLPAKVVAVANFKGGVGKTSTAAHLAMSAALDGYRVLVIDLDSQGSMTSIFGGRVADEWDTIFPLLARHYAAHLRRENQSRLDRGEAPIPMDDTLAEALEVRTEALARPTHWPNIDLIGAQLNLYWSEFQIPVWRMQSRSWKLWDALTDILVEDGALDSYDIVILDTPP